MNQELLPPIPSEFHNSETGLPFHHCLVCECNLMAETQPYSIERAIRHYPEMKLKSVVFEYALCAQCMTNMENELSDMTKLAIKLFFSAKLDLRNRPKWEATFDENGVLQPFNVSEWIETCAVNSLPRKELYEYSLFARCIGDRIIPEVVPYMISGPAQDELIALFSKESLGFMNDFTDRHFSGPPELKELFKGRAILV